MKVVLEKMVRPSLGTADKQQSHQKEVDDFSVFESLLSEISATYINLPLNDLEKAIKEDFARLSKALSAEVCILYVREKDRKNLQIMKPSVWYLDESKESNRYIFKWFKKDPKIDSGEFSFLFSEWNRGKSISWIVPDSIPEEAEKEKKSLMGNAITLTQGVPISFAGSLAGVISVSLTSPNPCWVWSDDQIPRLRLLGEVFFNALMRKRSEEKLQKALSEIKDLKERFEADYLYLKEEIKGEYEGVVGKSSALRNILGKVKQVALTNATVLILGETGTGKGLIARAIHDSSGRRERPLMQVNCAALAPSIIESELFGHEKGAFTGATTRRLGRFEAAKGTTLFLDEIGDLPLELQPKLLRILEEGEFERMGGNETIHTDVRLIAATSRDLEKEVAAGRFRSDLWYRLNIFPILVPPLRERKDDISLLAEHFICKCRKTIGKKIKVISLENIKMLHGYSWPGNIRELSNVIERAVIASVDGCVKIEIPSHQLSSVKNIKTLSEHEREYIIEILEKTNWKIKGVGGAAEYLDIHPETLRTRMRKLDIKRSNLVDNRRPRS